LAKAKRAEKDVYAVNKRAEEEERRQVDIAYIAAQAIATKEAKANTRSPTPKLQCTLKDF